MILNSKVSLESGVLRDQEIWRREDRIGSVVKMMREYLLKIHINSWVRCGEGVI